MFEQQDLTTLDADGTVQHAIACRAAADAAEVELLRTAAHYADLHGVLDDAANGGRSLPGTERLVALGGAGTPEVAEFAPAELGAALGVSDAAAAMLIGDALDLRHRLPRLWARIRAGQVKAWVGRKTARATRGCTAAVAAVVDHRVTPFAHKLSWGRLEPIIAAAAAEADPAQAAKDAEAAASRLGVFRQPGAEDGTITTILRNQAPDAIFFHAAVARVSDALALLGDNRDHDTRRAAAVGVLANPQATLDLYHDAATAAASETTDVDGPIDPPDPVLDPPQRSPLTQPTPGAGAAAGWCPSCFGRPAAQPDRPRLQAAPPAVLYLHLTDQALRSGAGVARLEDVGPVLLDQVKTWLAHSQVTIKPVLDLAGMAPVDAYEIPDRLRDAVHLINPADVFPYGTNTGRRLDIDHTIPWRSAGADADADPPREHPPDRDPPGDGDRSERDGPGGQTGIGNLGKLTRRHHRIKTHGGWQVQQPFPGIWIWRSPHGRHYLVDHTGTTPLGKAA